MFLCRQEGNGVFRSGVKVTIYLLFGLCFCSQFTVYRVRVCSWQILVFSCLGILLACVAFRNDTYEKKWRGSCLLCGMYMWFAVPAMLAFCTAQIGPLFLVLVCSLSQTYVL